MTIRDALQTRYLDRLLATTRGRAFVLDQLADAEGSDEGAIFDLLARRVDDTALQQMIRKHADDEERHARMFRDCAARNGGSGGIPEELLMIPRLDRELGNVFDRDMSEDVSVMESYLLLQVIEERAITQFGVIERRMRRHDPQSADVMTEIAQDEERHLKYCHAIARRYAPDDLTRMRTLRRYREAEARAFTATRIANMQHAVAHGFLDVTPVERTLWQGLGELSRRSTFVERTPYWNELAAA